MQVRQMRMGLWLLTALALIASGGVVYWGLQPPSGLQGAPGRAVTPHPSAASAGDPLPPIDRRRLRPLASLSLQRPLYDPEPEAEPEPVFEPPPLRVRLLGTVIEGDDAQAILVNGDGETVFKRVGETVDDATIEAIEEKSVEVTYHQRRRTLNADEG